MINIDSKYIKKKKIIQHCYQLPKMVMVKIVQKKLCQIVNDSNNFEYTWTNKFIYQNIC